MTTSELIRANLLSVRKELLEVVPHLSDDILNWAPAAGMRTIRGQFAEILGTEVSLLEALTGSSRKEYEALEAEYKAIPTVKGLIEAADEVRAKTLAYMDGLTEADFVAPASVSEGFAQWQEMNPVPVAEVLRLIARHEYYHVGQLFSYLWAKGDNPYTWDE